MNIITLNVETYFADDYTLSKMTTEEYVRDPRFETHVVGMRLNSSAPISDTAWFTHAQFLELAPRYDWANSALLCHHAHFDGLILSHHYGIKPAYYLDTLSMARLL